MLNKQDAIALAQVAQAAGINPANLKAQNPFSQEFNTPTGATFRMAVEAINPALAARLKADAGHTDSIPSLAYLAATEDDLRGATGALREEADRLHPELVAERQQAWEAEQLKQMEASVKEMAAARGFDYDKPRTPRSAFEANAMEIARLQQLEVEARRQQQAALKAGAQH